MRIVLGLIVGALVAALIVYLMTIEAHAFFPGSIMEAALSAPGNSPNPMGEVPIQATAMIVMGWFLGALIGACLGNLIAGRGFVGYVVAGFVVLYVLALSVQVPHPTWLSVLGVFLPLLAGFTARRIARVEL